MEACAATVPGTDDAACHAADIWSYGNADSQRLCEAAGACTYTRPVPGACPFELVRSQTPIAVQIESCRKGLYGGCSEPPGDRPKAVGDVGLIAFKSYMPRVLHFGAQTGADVSGATVDDYLILRNPAAFETLTAHAGGVQEYSLAGVPLCSSLELGETSTAFGVRDQCPTCEDVSVVLRCTLAPHAPGV